MKRLIFLVLLIPGFLNAQIQVVKNAPSTAGIVLAKTGLVQKHYDILIAYPKTNRDTTFTIAYSNQDDPVFGTTSGTVSFASRDDMRDFIHLLKQVNGKGQSADTYSVKSIGADIVLRWTKSYLFAEVTPSDGSSAGLMFCNAKIIQRLDVL